MLSGTFSRLSLRFSAVTTMSSKVAADDGESGLGFCWACAAAAAIDKARSAALVRILDLPMTVDGLPPAAPRATI
jgi:hypothetical protein